MKRPLILLFMMLSMMANAQQFIAEGRFPLAVIPSETSGVSKPKTSLNGSWEININPTDEVWKTNTGNWQKIDVPGEPTMQGFKVENDKEFFYRTSINIPADAKGKTTLIRFNGVYSYARVFVNGNFVREHFGGFTAWDADITQYVNAGEMATIYVGVTDRADDISYASGYAKHTIGGILREVQMLVVPNDYINRFYIDTDINFDIKEAVLTVNVAKKTTTTNGKVKFQLYDKKGKAVLKSVQTIELKNGEGKDSVLVKKPILWNQEEPYLYTLKAELFSEDKILEEKIEMKVGFRKVVVQEKQVLVNGKAIKLRGACRHDMHPLLGRSTNRYYDSLDVVKARQANMNFIRTSHYPPSQDFLEFADQLGIYVQEETAICFVNDWREGIYKDLGQTQDNADFTSKYLGQLSEMIDRDRNHASVIMWSIGNESSYGTNFQQSYDFVKAVDLSRPVSWSWAATALKVQKKCFDIAVAHYPSYKGDDKDNFGLKLNNMEHESMPLLSDEWAHVSCYNTLMLKNDPNIKDFWGRSLDMMWKNRFDVAGNLGGAIWGMTDEVFHKKDTVVGYGPWGIVDVWRREKVEFWNTKKAYSPIRVMKTVFDSAVPKGILNVPIKNRYNHINLDKIKLKVTYKGVTTDYKMPSIEAHAEGKIALKVVNLIEPVLLQFYDSENNLIDEEEISRKKVVGGLPHSTYEKWTIEKNDTIFKMKNKKGLSIQLDAVSGQLISANNSKEKILTGSPRVIVNKPLNHEVADNSMAAVKSGKFEVSKTEFDTEESGKVIVSAWGKIDDYLVTTHTSYLADGTISTRYEINNLPEYNWQIGVAFPIADSFKNIKWIRKGYWSTYPEGHLSTNVGTASRISDIKEEYRIEPKYNIAQSMTDYYLKNSTNTKEAYMNGSEIYRATKENIFYYNLISEKSNVKVYSEGNQSAKIDITETNQQELLVVDKLNYWSLGWGNFEGTKNDKQILEGEVFIHLD